MLVAALELALNGLYVFPLHPIADGKCSCDDPTCEDIGKHPAVTWKSVNTTDPAKVHQWWGVSPGAGIGIACGPSRIVGLDVDPKNGGDASFAALRSEIGLRYFETPTVRTGGGG